MSNCKLKTGDYVTIVDIDSLDEDPMSRAVFTEGKIYEVEEWGRGAKVVNDNGEKFYFSSKEVINNLVKVGESGGTMKEIKKLEVRIAQLEAFSKKQTEILEKITNINEKLIEELENIKSNNFSIVSTTSTEMEEDGCLEYNGEKYKRVPRRANRGDIIVYPKIGDDWVDITAGIPYYVKTIELNTPKFLDDNNDSVPVYGTELEDSEEKVLVYELVEEVEKNVEPVVDIYEQKIEEAKQFLEDCKTNLTGESNMNWGDIKKGQIVSFDDVYILKGEYPNKFSACKVEFIVLPEKNKVVALLRGFKSNKVYGRGIAVSYHGDVFNEDIGKAVALAKALGLDYSQFTNIPNPMNLKIGSVVKLKGIDEEYTIKSFESGERLTFEGKYYSWDFIRNIEKVIK